MSKKFFVYFKDFPVILDTFIRQDGNATIIKDGVKPIGHLCAARLTILMKSTLAISDSDRERRLINLLDELESNGQIITYRRGS